jgi:hypothetical protein
MASPGVSSREIDLSFTVKSEGGVSGGFVGLFQWGPVDIVTNVTDGTEGLARIFGKPNNDTATYWLSVRDYLVYNDSALVVRLVGGAARNSVPTGKTAVLVKNKDHYQTVIKTGIAFIGKYPGVLGNGIKIYIANSSGYAAWDYKDNFTYAPASTNEFNVVIVDGDGTWSGAVGTVLESFELMTVDETGKKDDGTSSYVVNVINNASKYVWVGDAVEITSSLSANGSSSFTLQGGVDANSSLTSHVAGWNLFDNPSTTDVWQLVMVNQSAADITSVNSITSTRGDCVGFLSPPIGNVVNNFDNESADIVSYRDGDANISSSLMFMDDNWKQVYDEFNDVYRWIPMSATSAGLHAQVVKSPQPWFSHAGYTRGKVKNIIKLAWNSKEANRNTLYRKNVNSYISEPGEGVVLFGDKTMQTRPSAFDRINVRNLFIVLRKAISKSAKYQVFDLNDTITRSMFTNRTSAFLQSVQSGRGIYDYSVKCDESNNTPEIIDSNGFIASIFVKPARSINFIQLNFVAVSTGLDFKEIENAV